MNESGATDREKLIEKFNQTFTEALLMLETMNDKNGIINGMITNHLIKKYEKLRIFLFLPTCYF